MADVLASAPMSVRISAPPTADSIGLSLKKPPTCVLPVVAPIPEVAIPVPIPTPRLIPVNKVPIAPNPLASAIGTSEV